VFLLAEIGAFLNVCAGRLSRIVDRARAIEPLILGAGFAIFLIETRLGSRSVRISAELLGHTVDEGD
jgi:hypothetical protein